MGDAAARHERDFFIDTLRVFAVLVVVAAHFATTTVIWEEGRIDGENALSVIPETHLATWILQVMPILFFAGGFANARSMDRHERAYLAYLRTRLRRLLTPSLAFMSVWLLVALVAEPLPLPEPNVVERAADIAALPFWFLGLYVAVVALAPPVRWLHERLGWWVPALMVVGAGTVDVFVHGFGFEYVGIANYAFVWLLPHQLGFFYADGRLERSSRWFASALASTGLVGLIAAVMVAGYPVSMVGVPGEDRWNTDPPSLALVALTVWLLGVALLAAPRIRLMGFKSRRVVGRLAAIPLTLYLWHVSALSMTAAVLYPLGFPRADSGSARWWAMRPLWVAAIVPFLVLLVAVFRRFEVHPAPRPFTADSGEQVRHVGAVIAVASLAFGILGFGVAGFDRFAADSGEGVLAFTVNPLQNVLHVAVGLGLLWGAYARRSAVPVVMAAAVLYLVLGAYAWPDGLGFLGMNPATAILHVVIGTLGMGLLVVAVVGDRRRRLGTRSPGSF